MVQTLVRAGGISRAVKESAGNSIIPAAPGSRVVLISLRGADEYGGGVERSRAAGFLSKLELSTAALGRLLQAR